jgi:hypothetical protein
MYECSREKLLEVAALVGMLMSDHENLSAIGFCFGGMRLGDACRGRGDL